MTKKHIPTSLVLEKIKLVSWNIMHKIQGHIFGFKDHEETIKEIKGSDSIINVFLKTSALLFKLITIESKIDHKTNSTNNEDVGESINNDDIKIIENFLSNYNKTKKGAKNED